MKIKQFLRLTLITCAATITVGIGLSGQSSTVSASSGSYKTVATAAIKKKHPPIKSRQQGLSITLHTLKRLLI